MDKIKESGLSQEAIAAALNISRVTLNEKLNGRSDFKVSEAKQLKETLNLTNEQVYSIFFDS
jgi:DNA-binding XRE family transcriptional regulator